MNDSYGMVADALTDGIGQATLYKMAQRVLAENAGVETVRYVLPNKHYIPVDMKYIGVDNTTPCVPFFPGGRAESRTDFENYLRGLIRFRKYLLPRVVEQEDDGERRGLVLFRSMPCSFILCQVLP